MTPFQTIKYLGVWHPSEVVLLLKLVPSSRWFKPARLPQNSDLTLRIQLGLERLKDACLKFRNFTNISMHGMRSKIQGTVSIMRKSKIQIPV